MNMSGYFEKMTKRPSSLWQRSHFIYILFADFISGLSGIFAKYASLNLGGYDFLSLLFIIFYIISLGFLVLQAIVWISALKYYDLSFAYPFISLVNFIILVSSYLLFNESITLANLIGLFLYLAECISYPGKSLKHDHLFVRRGMYCTDKLRPAIFKTWSKIRE